MTNIFSPFGIQDLQRRDGGSPTMGLFKAAISSTDANLIFTGDLVQVNTGTPASGGVGLYITQGSTQITAGSSAGQWVGVFRGCEYLNTAVGRVVWSPWWPGSNAGADAIAYYSADPEMYFIAQGSTGAVLGSSNVGMNLAVQGPSSAGNQTTGQSVIAITSSLPNTTATLPLRLIDFYSNYIGGFPPGLTIAGGSGFVNGTDNTNGGQVVVVALNQFLNNTTTGV